MRYALALGLTFVMVAGAALADGFSLKTLSATRERPLFSATRRPPPPPPKIMAVAPRVVIATTPVSSPPPQIELTGVVFGSAAPFALVRAAGQVKTMTVEIGSLIGSWRVLSISDRSLVLSNGPRSASFELRHPQAGADRIQIIERGPS
jgi:general secretion pathway protein N